MKTLIVLGAIGFNLLGAYRDTRSTSQALRLGGVEVGVGSRTANMVSGGVNVACVSALWRKKVGKLEAALWCAPAIANGVGRNVAATSNFRVIKELQAKKE